ARVEAKRTELAREKKKIDQEHARWAKRWEKSGRVLELGPEASTEAVEAMLDLHAELARHLDDAADRAERDASLGAALAALRGEILGVVEAHAPDLRMAAKPFPCPLPEGGDAAIDVVRAAEDLAMRWQAAQAAEAKRADLVERRERAERELAEHA